MAEVADLSRPFEDVALGSYQSCFVEDAADVAAQHPGLKRYLCYFIHRYLEFRIPEVEALAELAVGEEGWLGGVPREPCPLQLPALCTAAQQV